MTDKPALLPNLKRCPFCGSAPEYVAEGCVGCSNHHCTMRALAMKQDDWNHRADLAPLVSDTQAYQYQKLPTAEAQALSTRMQQVADRPPASDTLALVWQTIDSAPKDGTDFLAWSPLDEQCEVTYWYGGKFKASFDHIDSDATHWMPLPKPPALGGEHGDD